LHVEAEGEERREEKRREEKRRVLFPGHLTAVRNSFKRVGGKIVEMRRRPLG
jgi:hypothetical protein